MSTISNKITVKSKKRSRIAYADHKRPGPEIKKTNFFFNPASAGNTLYSSMIFVPFASNIPSGRTDMRAFFNFCWFQAPTQGTASYQRVGTDIRIKQILFKGYLEVRQNLLSQCRVRVYFIRQRNQQGTQGNLWKNAETIDETAAAAAQIVNMKHNFYKMLVDSTIQTKDLTIQKIMEFNLTPYVSPNTNNSWTGLNSTATTWTANFHMKPQYQTAYCLPIHKVISLNENYNCDGRDHYALFMMCDAPFAGDSGMLPTDEYPSFTNRPNLQPFMLNFFSLVYYTDA